MLLKFLPLPYNKNENYGKSKIVAFYFLDNWLQQRRKNLDKIDMQLKAILWKDFWKQVGSEEEDKKENWRQSNDNGFLF